MRELTRSFGRSDNAVLRNHQARHAGVLTAGELRALDTDAQQRVHLPGLIGTPDSLLASPARAESAFRAARRVTELTYDTTPGLDPTLKVAGLALFDERQADLMHHLFSGEADTDPVIARRDALVALTTAAQTYQEFLEGAPKKT